MRRHTTKHTAGSWDMEVCYEEYMKSDEWKDIRNERMKIDGYKCQLCGTAKNLQCHHVSYEHLGKLGEIDDIITLCKSCHKRVHEEDLRIKEDEWEQ